MDWSIAVLVWIVCGIACILIAQNKGATNLVSWFLVGIFLGPIGIILALVGAGPPSRSNVEPVPWAQPQPQTPTSSGWVQTPAPPQGSRWSATPAPTLPVNLANAGFCPRDGTPRSAGLRFCATCGLDFAGPPPSG